MSKKIPEDTGHIIKSIRLGLGLTQSKFGELIGVRAASVSDWENNKTKPTQAVWNSICFRYPDKVPQDSISSADSVRQPYPNYGQDITFSPEILSLITMAIEVLKSETHYAVSLNQNIKSFYRGLAHERGDRRKEHRPDAIPDGKDRRKTKAVG